MKLTDRLTIAAGAFFTTYEGVKTILKDHNPEYGSGRLLPQPLIHSAASATAAANMPEAAESEELVSLEEADAEENTGKVKAVVPESEDDIEVDETIEGDDDDDSTFIPDEEEGDEDVTDIIGDVGGDEET